MCGQEAGLVIIEVTIPFGQDVCLVMGIDESVEARVIMTLGFFNVGVAAWVLLTVITLLMLALAYIYVRRPNSNDLPIQLRSQLLSPAQKNFFEYLVDSLSDDFFIFAKVAISDVVETSAIHSKGTSQLIYNRLNNRCFDFILCKKHDLSIFGIVELENFDANKSDNDKAIREKLITDVCKSAHLRLFYFDLRQDYRGVDIRRLVTGKSSKTGDNGLASVTAQPTQFTIDDSSYAAFARGRSCPQCNGEVVTKVAVKGKRIGEKILMCRKYPYCDYRASISDEDVIQKMQNNRVVQSKLANS